MLFLRQNEQGKYFLTEQKNQSDLNLTKPEKNFLRIFEFYLFSAKANDLCGLKKRLEEQIDELEETKKAVQSLREIWKEIETKELENHDCVKDEEINQMVERVENLQEETGGAIDFFKEFERVIAKDSISNIKANALDMIRNTINPNSNSKKVISKVLGKYALDDFNRMRQIILHNIHIVPDGNFIEIKTTYNFFELTDEPFKQSNKNIESYIKLYETNLQVEDFCGISNADTCLLEPQKNIAAAATAIYDSGLYDSYRDYMVSAAIELNNAKLLRQPKQKDDYIDKFVLTGNGVAVGTVLSSKLRCMLSNYEHKQTQQRGNLHNFRSSFANIASGINSFKRQAVNTALRFLRK